jgi:hypothetical protein
MRVKVGSVAYLQAAKSGYGMGLDSAGHRIEFVGTWPAFKRLRGALDGPEPVYLELDDWQVLAVDGEVQQPLSHAVMAERAAFLRSAMDDDT